MTTAAERLADAHPALVVYTDRNGRPYVVDDALPPGPIYRVTKVEARSGLRIWVEFQRWSTRRS